MEIMTTTNVYHNETMDLSGGNGSFWEDNDENDDYNEDEQTAYEDVHKSLMITSLTILSLICVLGVLGNGVVIWVTGFKMKKTVNTVWYLNLAVADFLVTVFLPLEITEMALDDWPFGKVMCKLNTIILLMNMYVSIFILVVISVDRCVCVVWPVWAKNHRSVRKASFVSLGVWVLALALSSPHFFRDTLSLVSFCNFMITDDYSPQTFFRFEAMIITRFLMGFVVPFTVIVSCYSVIIYRLRRNRSLASQSGRPFKIIAAVITTFFLCWAPFHIMGLIVLCIFLGYDSETMFNVIDIGFPIVISLAFLNSCLNPLLYVFMGQDFKDVFRRSVLKVLEKAFSEELPQTNTSTNPGIASYSKENSFSEAQV